jgi:hypothetical protein
MTEPPASGPPPRTDTQAPSGQTGAEAGAGPAAHVLDTSAFVQAEAASQGLGEPLPPAPVPVPPPGEPRGGGYPIDDQLGTLAQLPGTWIGNGFNVIARPDEQEGKEFFLMLSATKETLQFTAISAPIPNRGSKQGDISFLGLTYLQQINDAISSGGLHLEPGIWLNVPATSAPQAPASLVRLASIPHGNALLAQGQGYQRPGAPAIPDVSTIPVREGGGMLPDGYTEPFIRPSPPEGIPARAVINPNQLLQEAIAGQTITATTVLLVATKPVGGIENIPFLTVNAEAVSMSATFWIETVQQPYGGNRLQLQYSQTVLLVFDGIIWPHVSVGTLLKR